MGSAVGLAKNSGAFWCLLPQNLWLDPPTFRSSETISATFRDLRPLQVSLGLVPVLLPRQPLHVAWIVPPTLAKWHNVIHLAVLATRGFRMGPLELLNGAPVLLDPPVAISRTALTLD